MDDRAGGTTVSEKPQGRTAPGTHPLELQRLALQEQMHSDCDPLRVQAITWLMRAHAAITAAQAEELRPLGLSPSGFCVLAALLNTPGGRLEPRQIAERLQLSRPSVTGLLDTLQDRGFVVRRPHSDDRRRVLVELTHYAEQTLHDHYPTHYKEQARLVEGLSDDELATLVQLLRKVSGAVPAELADPASGDGPAAGAPAS